MPPVGSIWKWNTDGSIGIIISEPSYEGGTDRKRVKVYFINNHVKFQYICAQAIKQIVRNEVVIRLDSEDSDG